MFLLLFICRKYLFDNVIFPCRIKLCENFPKVYLYVYTGIEIFIFELFSSIESMPLAVFIPYMMAALQK